MKMTNFINSIPTLKDRWELAQKRTETETQRIVARLGENNTITSTFNAYGTINNDMLMSLNQYVSNTENKTLEVNVNSYGGDFVAGVGIYNTLRNDGRPVITNNMGLAASAASIIYLAGEERNAFEQSTVMMHNARMITAGGAKQLRRDADKMETIDKQIEEIVSNRTTIKREQMLEMFENDTFVDAKDQVELGITNTIIPTNKQFDNKTIRDEILAVMKEQYFKE